MNINILSVKEKRNLQRGSYIGDLGGKLDKILSEGEVGVTIFLSPIPVVV